MAYIPVSQREKEKEDPLTKTEEDIPGYQAPHGHPMYGVRILGEEKTGKNETRLYGVDATTKQWLTKEEAEAKGLPWKDETSPKEATQKK